MRGLPEMTASNVARRSAALGAVLLLAGCISLGGKVPEQLIMLTPQKSAPAGALGGGKIADAVVVLDPEADRRIDVQRVAVRIDDSSLAYLKDATWVERPARQFRRLLAEAIRARSGRLVLESGDAEAVGKDTISGRLLDIGYDARSQSVVVRFDAMRSDTRGGVKAQRFEARVPGIAPKSAQVAPALNRAANDVAAQVADWVG
jgi:cholesterol transport system auxiliary component